MKKEVEKSPVKTKLRKDDVVVVISGKYKGVTGKIISLDRDRGRVIVESVNLQKKTMKKTQQNQQGGIIEKEGFIHISNVMYYDGKAGTRLSYKIEGEDKKRVMRKTKALIGKNV